MNFKKAATFLLLALLSLFISSCMDGEESVYGRVDEYGVQYSPTYMRGVVRYLKTMKPEKVKVISLDAKLNPIDSIEAALKVNDWGENIFSVVDRDYPYPVIKLVVTFPLGENEKMEFSQYVRLKESNIEVELSLPKALMSGRIETLMLEEDSTFERAEAQAVLDMRSAFNTNMDDVMSNNMTVYEYHGNTERLNGLLLYIYCRHEISDSVFYSTFNEFYKDFAKAGNVSDSLMAKSADAYLSTFMVLNDEAENIQFMSFSRDSVLGICHCDYDFFKRAYGISLALSSETFMSESEEYCKLDNEYSSYNGRTFVYDKALGFWRLQTSLEDVIGVCLFRKDSVTVNDGIRYHCEKYSGIWKEEPEE